MQPPCNSLYDGVSTEEKFPLEINVCETCWHSQLACVPSNMERLFRNYPYRTGVSQTLVNHYRGLANHIKEYIDIPITKVLDIGCNDGTLLKNFVSSSTTYGIDPWKVEGVDVVVDNFIQRYWDKFTSAQLQGRQFEVITATNVLAHNTNPKKFLQLAVPHLDWEGIMVLEFPYSRDLIEHVEFDTIYHEHVSYFNANSFWKLLEGTGLYVQYIEIIEVHGGSLRVFLSRCHPTEENKYHTGNLSAIIAKEKSLGLHSVRPYDEFSDKVEQLRYDVQTLCSDMLRRQRILCGFGASGKSSVFLNYTSLPLKFIVDETPAKIGKFSPGWHVPIVGLDYLMQEAGPLDIFIFAWNCLSECLDKLRLMRDPTIDDQYIIYVPKLEFRKLHGF